LGKFSNRKRRQVGRARGFDHRLVFGGVLVGLEQDLVELLADGLRALALGQCLRPFGDLQLQQALLLDRGQRLLHDFGRRLLEAPLAGAAEVVRCLVQAQQGARLL